jgi:hypothetical protein
MFPEDSETDEESEHNQIRVLDSKQYTQYRRLEQIHDAREDVRAIRQKAHESVHEDRKFTQQDYKRYVAEMVVDYGIELEPIMVKNDFGFLEREPPDFDVTISDLLDSGGKVNGEYVPVGTSRWVKRQLDRFMAEVGIGIDVEDDKEPAEI